MKKPKKISKPRKKSKIRVKKRKLGRESAWGLCWFDRNLIELDPRRKGKWALRDCVHELIHYIMGPNFSEAKTVRAEKILGDTLWELGYRNKNE